ncbi:NAD(P)-dependent oxidoreductase [Lysobacter sp. TAB13]|uniref:NAD(P)-dependent oxidoreductase n=1 Tax=Lysobacter sp. TAB13 TaxID=3233065 RepID=UPI003F988BE6
MALFPLLADLSGRPVLVVGGGEVAVRKIEALLRAGARVRVHARALDPVLQGWLEQGRLTGLDGEFDPAWLDGVWLLVAATDDHAFNARLAEQARARGLWANIVDDAQLSSVQIPAVVDRAPLQVAISSGGAAPMLARRIRERLEIELDHSLGDFAALFARHRDAIRKRFPALPQRRRWFDRVIDGPVSVLLRNGRHEDAERAFRDALESDRDDDNAGSVALVGAGDGDPGSLTLKALRVLNQADVLVCDPALSAAVIDMARRDATRLIAPQERDALVELLVRHAGNGMRVAYIKGGDAFRMVPDKGLLAMLERRNVIAEVVAGVSPTESAAIDR